MDPTEDAFRALARSSPWRWRTLHFTYVDDYENVEAWVRRPGQLRVRKRGSRQDHVVDERSRIDVGSAGRRLSLVFLTSGSGDARPSPPPPPTPPRWPHEVEPRLREDGLVSVRPSDLEVEYDDPMYQSYDWVAMLDPVELSHHTSVTDVREGERLGRRTWWARVRAEEGYDPRCGCCPLLWSFIADRDEDGDPDWRPPAGTVYPKAYDVALDHQTGVVVERSPVGPSSQPTGHRMEILEVDVDLRGLLPG